MAPHIIIIIGYNYTWLYGASIAPEHFPLSIRITNNFFSFHLSILADVDSVNPCPLYCACIRLKIAI